MTEKDLVELWNSKRKQLISAQFHSVVALAVLTVLAVMGNIEQASGLAVLFAALFLLSVGTLSLLTQFAIIREAKSLVAALGGLDNLGPVGRDIANSGRFLTMTQALMTVFSIALAVSFVLVIL